MAGMNSPVLLADLAPMVGDIVFVGVAVAFDHTRVAFAGRRAFVPEVRRGQVLRYGR